MKKTYCAGEYYNFTVTGISNNRIYLKDDQGDTFSVNAFDFQTEWDWASPQVPANLMKCYVKEVYGSGKLVLEEQGHPAHGALPRGLSWRGEEGSLHRRKPQDLQRHALLCSN